jgi:cyclase
MNKGYLLLLGVLLSAGLASGAPQKPLKLADGVWAMATTEGGANAGWFTFGGSVVAVDSGRNAEDARAILAAIAETTGKMPVSYLILTSNFTPHAAGAFVFAQSGATIVCHEKFATGILQTVLNAVPAKATGAAPTKPVSLLTLSQRLMLADGSRQVEVDFAGPADSGGDLVVYLRQEQVLFSGDLAVTAILPPLFSAAIDPDGWIRALVNISHVPVKQLVPGYGPIGSLNGVQSTLGYMTETWDLVQKIAKENTPVSFIATRLQQPDARMAIPDELKESHVLNVTELVKWLRAKNKGTVEPKKP